MDEQQQKNLIKKTKIKMWIGIILIIVVGLAIAVYFVFINPIEKDEGVVNTVINVDETRECTYTSNTCQEGYYCYHEVSGGLGHDGPLPIETIGGDQMCHKLCDVNADCATGESCVTEDISIEDYIEVVSFCKSGVDSNKVVSDNMVTDISEWQTYEDKVNGYSVKYPADYLIKMETNGYVVFDPTSIDTPNTTYLHISVNVEDNDFHTYRLGILTNSVVQGDTISEEDVTIDGLSGKKITYKDALGTTIIHYIVNYFGKVYDISAGDSVDSDILGNVISNFNINQLDSNIDVSDVNTFTDKACVSNNDCGAYPCYENVCLVQACTDDSECLTGTCGQYITPVPGYCTMIDSL